MKLSKKFKVLSVGMLLVVTLASAIGCSSNSGDKAYNEIDAAKTEELVGETKKTLVIDVRDADAYAKGHLTNAINIPFDEFEGKISDAAKTEELVGETKKTLVIDVRDADAYAKGHLTNAINIPFDEFEGKISELESYKDQTIVLICNTGNKSGKAAQMLVDNGFKKVYNAADGMEEHEYATVTYTNITGSQFEELATKNKDAVILDLRDSKDFEKKHALEILKILKKNMQKML